MFVPPETASTPGEATPALGAGDQRPADPADVVRFLSSPGAYAPAPADVEVRETHMSYVFLAGDRAFKLKKPARHAAGLDYTTVERRRWACLEEVRLNRRLARDVYLGVVRLAVDDAGRLGLGGAGRTVDWLVEMRRLPDAAMLDRAIAEGRADPRTLEPAARLLAGFYRDATPVGDIVDPCTQLLMDLDQDLRELRRLDHGLPAPAVARVGDALSRAIERDRALIERRAREGHLVEGHGDLRPEHIALAPRPVVIDCLEFNRRLRILDPVDELGYLALECERLGDPRAGAVFLDVYRDATGDRPPPRLIALHQGRRALLRAKLALWHPRDARGGSDRWAARARHYLDLAADRAGRLG
jgi:aminoglycoside phosphotransferase family enzyme